MNILIYAHFAGSPYHGMVEGHYYLAKKWVELGHSVTIISSSFTHIRNRNPPKFKGTFKSENIDGIEYIWINTNKYDGNSSIGRILNLLIFSYKTFFSSICIKDNPDVIIYSSHHPLAIFSAKKYAKKFNCKLIFEIRDLWPLTLIKLGGVSRFNPIIILMQLAEVLALKWASVVVSVLSNSCDYLVKKGMNPDKFAYIPNGVSVDFFNAEGSTDFDVDFNILDQISNNGKIIIGYSGKLGLSNALDNLINAITFTDENIHVAILGDGPCKMKLIEQAISLGVTSRVHFFDSVMKSKVGLFLSKIDIAYLGIRYNEIFNYGVSPNKLADYMIAKKIVIGAFQDPEKILLKSGAGVYVSPDDPIELAEIISRFSQLDKDEAEEIGRRGRDWIIKHRNYNKLSKAYIELMSSS